MSIFELRKKLSVSLTLILAAVAFSMLPACSSTDEAPPAEESSSSGGSYDECVAGCGAGDVDCREMCVREYTP